MGSELVPSDPSQVSNMWLRLRASYATGASWVDETGGRTFNGTNTPAVTANDATFNNQASVTFDGSSQYYLDGGAAADYGFMMRNDSSGSDWHIAMCFALTSPATAALQRFVWAGTSGSNPNFQLWKSAVASGTLNIGVSATGNTNPFVSSAVNLGASTAAVWIMYGFRPTIKGNSVQTVSYAASTLSYTTKGSFSWNGTYTGDPSTALYLGRDAVGTHGPFRLAELYIAKSPISRAKVQGISAYFTSTYGATP